MIQINEEQEDGDRHSMSSKLRSGVLSHQQLRPSIREGRFNQLGAVPAEEKSLRLPRLLAKRYTEVDKLETLYESPGTLGRPTKSQTQSQSGYSIQHLRNKLNGLIAETVLSKKSARIERVSLEHSKATLASEWTNFNNKQPNFTEVSASVIFSKSIGCEQDQEGSSLLVEKASGSVESPPRSQFSKRLGGHLPGNRKFNLPVIPISDISKHHRRSKTLQGQLSKPGGHVSPSGLPSVISARTARHERSDSNMEPQNSSLSTEHKQSRLSPAISRHARSQSHASLSKKPNNLHERAQSFFINESGYYDPNLEIYFRRKKEQSILLKNSLQKTRSVRQEKDRLKFINNDLLLEMQTLLKNRREGDPQIVVA